MNATRAGIALGSNLGDRLANFCAARDQLLALEDVIPPFLLSSIFETEPVDCEAGAAAFYNAVIEIGYNLSPAELLISLRQIEAQLGRAEEHGRNESRVIDLDLLYFGAVTIDSALIKLPHPRMHRRRFVLAPLAEIRGDLRLPGRNVSVAELLDQLQDPAAARRALTKW